MKSLRTTRKSTPDSPQLEKSPRSKEDPEQPKINKRMLRAKFRWVSVTKTNRMYNLTSDWRKKKPTLTLAVLLNSNNRKLALVTWKITQPHPSKPPANTVKWTLLKGEAPRYNKKSTAFVMKNIGPEHCGLLPRWSSANFKFLCLCFFICKMGIIMLALPSFTRSV